MALEQIHVKGFCILGVQTKFILQNKSIVRAIPCLGKTHTKLYTLFRTERSKPIPCPVAHPLIGHITESPLPPPPSAPGLQLTCSHLYSTFWQIDFQGDFLSHEDVRIFCFGEQLVQKFQLRLRESCSFSSLFSWGSCQVKKKKLLSMWTVKNKNVFGPAWQVFRLASRLLDTF